MHVLKSNTVDPGKQIWKLSRYHLAIVAIYLVAMPLLFVTLPHLFAFGFSIDHFYTIGVVLLILTLVACGIYLMGIRPSFRKAPILKVLAAATFFAFFIVLPEELIFRGLFQGSLQERLINPWLAIVLSSLVFGAVHLVNKARSIKPVGWNWKLAFWVSLAGLPLGYLFYTTGSLIFPILLHTLLLTCANLTESD